MEKNNVAAQKMLVRSKKAFALADSKLTAAVY
jgi:hypothetical protein